MTLTQKLDPALLAEIVRVAQPCTVKEGDFLIDYGQPITVLPILTAGRVGVYSVDARDQTELYLYALLPDETCALTLGCCLYKQPSQVRAIAETDASFLAVPLSYISIWLDTYPSFRQFVYQNLSGRFIDLIRVVEALAFSSLPQRLEDFLHQKVREQDSRLIGLTHEQVAGALGTSRVVVSRMLKQLERQGKVLLFRHQIKWMGDL